MTYRIREVDASDEDISETIREFNKIEFAWPPLTDEELEGENCHWWFAYDEKNNPIAFSGLNPSIIYKNAGYFKRVGVLAGHRGGLQLRFFRALERRAKNIGWNMIVSETTDTVYSANNFIRAGYRLFDPQYPWAFPTSLYWKKFI